MQRLIRRRELLAKLGVTHTTLYNWMRDRGFPHPISLGENSVAWLVDEVDTFIEQRRAERDRQLELPLAEAE